MLSEALCCLLCGLYIKKKVKILCLGRKWRVFDRRLFYKTVQFGWVSAMQQATVQLGKIGIQAIVNTMGISVMAAFAVVNRIDDFAYTPEQNIAHAMTALLAQNKGAGKKERIREGFRCGLWIEMIYALFICVVCFVFARPLMKLFVMDEEVISLGVIYLHAIAAMYFLPAATNGIQGYFRGMGDLKVTLISSFYQHGSAGGGSRSAGIFHEAWNCGTAGCLPDRMAGNAGGGDITAFPPERVIGRRLLFPALQRKMIMIEYP